MEVPQQWLIYSAHKSFQVCSVFIDRDMIWQEMRNSRRGCLFFSLNKYLKSLLNEFTSHQIGLGVWITNNQSVLKHIENKLLFQHMKIDCKNIRYEAKTSFFKPSILPDFIFFKFLYDIRMRFCFFILNNFVKDQIFKNHRYIRINKDYLKFQFESQFNPIDLVLDFKMFNLR